MKKRVLGSEKGFGFLEVFFAIAVLLIFIFSYNQHIANVHKAERTTSVVAVRDRIIAGVRTIAKMPAALRNSMRATDGVTIVNPELLACIGANPPGTCKNGTVFPLTLYSPIVNIVGNSYSIKPISAPLGSQTPLRFDLYGVPCAADRNQTDCPLMLFTSFKANCPPEKILTFPGGPIAANTLNLAPAATCTVAESIEVFYSVLLDPKLTLFYPELSAFIQPVEGSVVAPVLKVSGNLPQ
jgi:hypothetical protein